MIFETLITAFVVGFVAIALLGHVLLAQALLSSDRAEDSSQSPADTVDVNGRPAMSA